MYRLRFWREIVELDIVIAPSPSFDGMRMPNARKQLTDTRLPRRLVSINQGGFGEYYLGRWFEPKAVDNFHLIHPAQIRSCSIPLS
jgi:hypothetical protein